MNVRNVSNHCKACNEVLEDHELIDDLCFECLGVVQKEIEDLEEENK